MFVTLFFAVLDLNTLQLHFSSAGHTAPSLLRNGECLSITQQAGPALALMTNLEFPVNVLRLQPNDLLAVYTDGIDEAFNNNKEQFSTERFNHLLEQTETQNLAELGQSVFSTVDDHAGDMPQSDDITCLLLQIPVSTDKQFSLSLTDESGAINSLIHWLEQRCAQAGLNAHDSKDVLLVSEEAVTNIFKYAELPGTDKVEVIFEGRAEQVTLTFRDTGRAFDPLTEAARTKLGQTSEHADIGGLGVHLLLALTDTQHYQRIDNCNVLVLTKQISDES
jgi:sigma-B regulation protein RsbU (phosphoserine phosphatase)